MARSPFPSLEGGLGSRLEPLWQIPLSLFGGGSGFETRATMARSPFPSLEGGLGSRLEPLWQIPFPSLEGGLGSRLEPLWPDPPFPLWRGVWVRD